MQARPTIAIYAILLSVSFVLPSCRHVQLDQGYSPRVPISQQDAVQIITRALEEQPADAATKIEVSPTKLTFERSSGRFLRGGSTRGTGFYFDSLGKMDITAKGGVNVVRVWDASGVFRFRVVISDPARAQQFVDAIASMAKP